MRVGAVRCDKHAKAGAAGLLVGPRMWVDSLQHGVERKLSARGPASKPPGAAGEGKGGSVGAARLSLFYAAFYLGFGAAMPYWPVWYAERGLSPEMIGIAGGAGLTMRMIVSPLAGYWGDSARRARDPLIVLSWLTLALWIAHVPAREPWTLVALAALTGAALYPIIPLNDGLAVNETRRRGIAFGPVRSVGSGAFIAANLGCGVLIGWWGGEAMLGWTIVMAALMAGAAHLLPAGEERRRVAHGDRLRGITSLLLDPGFLLALAGAGLIKAGHGFYYSFSVLAWRQQGLSDAVSGALWGVGVAAEIGFFALSARLARVIGPTGFIVLGGAAATVRWLGLAASPDLPALLALQLLHGLSFGAAFLGFVMYAERAAGESRVASALAVNAAVSGGAMTAVFTAASGWLFAAYGAGGFAAMAIPSVLGMVIAAAIWLLPQPQSAGEGGSTTAPR